MSDKLDLERIMERMQRLLVECEAETQTEGWRIRLHVHAVCHHGAGQGMVSFTVGTPYEDDEDDEDE